MKVLYFESEHVMPNASLPALPGNTRLHKYHSKFSFCVTHTHRMGETVEQPADLQTVLPLKKTVIVLEGEVVPFWTIACQTQAVLLRGLQLAYSIPVSAGTETHLEVCIDTSALPRGKEEHSVHRAWSYHRLHSHDCQLVRLKTP